MNSQITDCIVVGPQEGDLQTGMARMEELKDFTGAYRFWKSRVLRYRGRWMSHLNLLNTLLTEATGKTYGLDVGSLPHLGVFYLKTYLARRGLQVEIVNRFTADRDRLAALLDSGSLAVAITTSFYTSMTPVAEIVRFIRSRNGDARIIVGGPCVFDICQRRNTDAQDQEFSRTGADIYINDAQGEETLERVLRALRKANRARLDDVSNLIYNEAALFPRGSKPEARPIYRRTDRQAENNSMDDNPIDWSLFPKASYSPTTLMRTSRGCPFACAYCNYPVIAGAFKTIGTDVIEREMRQLHGAGVQNLIFVDDSFNMPLNRFKEILRMMIANRFRFNWYSFFRCGDADEEAFDLMKESGCRAVSLGIESGNQTILDAMNKRTSIEKYMAGIRHLNERDIVSRAFFIVGFPGETEASVRQTVAFIEEARPTYYILSLFFYDHRTPIRRKAEAFGLKGQGFNWRHHTMDWRQACDHIERMHREIQGSTLYSSGWPLFYLNGLGVPMEAIRRFYELSRPVLLKNFESVPAPAGEIDAATHEQLIAIAGQVARHLGGPH